ncbi:MAG: SDR family NAD(P)-dependent oxidoreductase [Pseudomonadota bacterium]
MRFENKAAIVTGAAHGIGQAIARRLAREGARVLICDIDLEAAQTVAEDIGDSASARRCDVSKRADVEAAVAAAVADLGQLDVMVANAGIVDRAPFLEMTDALFDRVIATNLNGTFYACQSAARAMVAAGTPGAIVTMASNSGIFGGRGRAAYGASKAGIINMTQTMAIELAGHGIRVNAVAPGATRTRVTHGDTPPDTVVARMPMARYGEPDEIAAVAAFLASDEASFTTGHVYCADGGFTVAGVMEG